MRWLALALLIAAPSATAFEVPCDDPLPPAHDNATEYRTKDGPDVYTVRWVNPNFQAGDIVACHIKIGTVFLFNETNPTSGACFEEDVSSETGRHQAEMWCESIDGDSVVETTIIRLKIPGRPPKLH